MNGGSSRASFSPAIVDAAGTKDERDAVRLFGELFATDGALIKSGDTSGLSLPDFVLGGKENDPGFGDFLESIGGYLSEMALSFPWDQYGINGKVFTIEEPN